MPNRTCGVNTCSKISFSSVGIPEEYIKSSLKNQNDALCKFLTKDEGGATNFCNSNEHGYVFILCKTHWDILNNISKDKGVTVKEEGIASFEDSQ